MDHFAFWKYQGNVRHSGCANTLEAMVGSKQWVVWQNNTQRSHPTGIGQQPGSSANRPGPLSGCGRPSSLPFSQGSWERFQRVSWEFGPWDNSSLPLFPTLSQAYIWSGKIPLLIPLSPLTTRSGFFKSLTVSHSKERHLISQPDTHTHTHSPQTEVC